MARYHRWMRWALAEARFAATQGEVPVGALVLHRGAVIAAAHNRREMDRDPMAHAEVLALRQASQRLGRWRLFDCTLVVTLEPCAMCAGALVNGRVDRVVFAAHDPKAGAVESVFKVPTEARLNHRVEVVSGVMADESVALLRDFFRARRA